MSTLRPLSLHLLDIGEEGRAVHGAVGQHRRGHAFERSTSPWRPHTVRGAFAGALKKKLGLTIESEKVEGRGRVCKIRD